MKIQAFWKAVRHTLYHLIRAQLNFLGELSAKNCTKSRHFIYFVMHEG